MKTASEIIAFGKSKGFNSLRIEGSKKIQGHTSTHLTLSKHNIYDLHVWGTAHRFAIQRIDLRNADADEKISKYI